MVGATSYASSVICVFQDLGLLTGLVLYARDNGITEPIIHLDVARGRPFVKIRFNFNMERNVLRLALSQAFQQLTTITGTVKLPIIYYQTDTLLFYHPCEFLYCVTHHGPFAQGVMKLFGDKAAATAFGNADKLKHLLHQQELGIQYLSENKNGFILQISRLQQEYLVKHGGILRSRFLQLTPPIEAPFYSSQALPKDIATFLDPRRTLLFTAVARLDFFKNIELLIRVGVKLLERNVPVKILIVGDCDDVAGHEQRTRLLAQIPSGIRFHFKAVPKLAKPDLFCLFYAVREYGIFVCPSRYETLGITPLEAASAGVTTLITRSRRVEASHYFPKEMCIPSDVESLTSAVERLTKEALGSRGQAVQKFVRSRLGYQSFRTDLVKAWALCSKAALL